MCGEIAADPQLAPLLVGLGIENLAIAPSCVPSIWQALEAVTQEQCDRLADRCLGVRTAAEVRRILGLSDRRPSQPSESDLAEGHAVDPVCGMIVHTEPAQHTLILAGNRFHFCSAHCAERFRQARSFARPGQ